MSVRVDVTVGVRVFVAVPVGVRLAVCVGVPVGVFDTVTVGVFVTVCVSVMVGVTVGEVVASRNPNFALGDIVVGNGGWQDYAVANGSSLRKLNPAAAPVSTALGVLGMPGMTAYAGLLEIGRPKAGEAVGSRRRRARSARWSGR